MKAKTNCPGFVAPLPKGLVLMLLFHVLGNSDAAPLATAFTYQGRLSDSSAPLTGRYDFVFGLHALPSDGSAMINVTNLNISVSNGLFTTAIDFGAVFNGNEYWLQIQVRTNGSSELFATLSPRQLLTATPNAQFATLAGSVPDNSIDAQKISAGSAADGNVLAYSGGNLVWTSAPGQDCWRLRGNSGTIPWVNFLGTTDNQPLHLAVNGKPVFQLVPTRNTPSIIGGYYGNYATTEAVGVTISGGGAEIVENSVTASVAAEPPYERLIPNFASIGGGANNRIDGADYSTIGGGLGNQIATHRVDEGHRNTITGGERNTIYMASYSSINGGQGNCVLGETDYPIRYGSIGGGASNTLDRAGWYSTIGGGSQNQIMFEAPFATIGGGRNNVIFESDADGATIGGGAGNTVRSKSGTIGGGTGNGVQAAEATIGGGIGNSILSGAYAATISGGSSNLVMASPESLLNQSYAMIPGGRDNTAVDYCFAAGRRAKATNTGAFVWADSADFDFGSHATNEFAVRAIGGVRLVTAIDAAGAPLAGATLAAGSGSWSSLSDRTAKDNFAPANAREILDKVASLPVSTWNYKAQDKSIRHIGPTAQDFHAAFDVGENDRTITTVDADGVALAAIQGLKQKLEQREARIRDLEARLAALEHMIKGQSLNR